MSLLPDDYVQTAGEYFGYPQCCIDDFKSRDTALTITPEQRKVHNFVGFIPCPACTERILKGEITQAELITNRKCLTPFPADNPQVDKRYIYEQMPKMRQSG